MTEAELSRNVRRLVDAHKLFGYHVPDSRRARPGFPDWFILGPAGFIFRELKSPYGQLSGDQRQVGYQLQALGADWDVWRPLDFATGRIARELAALGAAA